MQKSILLLFLILLTSSCFSKDEVKNKIIGVSLSENEVQSDIFTDSGTVDLEVKKEEVLNAIKSKVRVLCRIKNIETLLGSTTFTLIKDDIYKKGTENFQIDNFLYVRLPSLVYYTCEGKDTSYLEKLLRYLQNSNTNIIVEDKGKSDNLDSFIDSISFSTKNIDTQKIRTDSIYFNEVFFENNLENIKSSYFSEYLVNKGNANDFFYTYSIYSLEETNKRLEKSIGKLDSFIKDLGYKSIEEFRTDILKHNGYSNLEGLKKDLVDQYKKLGELTSVDLEFDINNQLISTDSLYKFYNGENYKKVMGNEEGKKILEKIGKGYLYFSIINNDYADGLDETWSGKQFFGDSAIGNGIIKLGYIYLINK